MHQFSGNSHVWQLDHQDNGSGTIDPVKDDKTTSALEKALYSTLRLHSKDFTNMASKNNSIIDNNVEWEQVKGKTLQIQPDLRAESR